MRQVIYILSTDDPMPAVFSRDEAAGRVRPVRQDRLDNADLVDAAGLVAAVSLDQVDMLDRRAAVGRLLATGGRLVICGHVLRPYVEGLSRFVPMDGRGRADYVLTRLYDHPVFNGISTGSLETNRGVAGFYGRGHNPPPPGAMAVTGLGTRRVPVDWVWHRPDGGAIFMHSGNDLWGVGDDPAVKQLIASRLIEWVLAGRTGAVAS